MSGHLFDKYGAILQEDVNVLERCLLAVIADKVALGTNVVSVVEIGMHDGNTARGIENFLHDHNCELRYFGIDVDQGKTRPRYVPAGGTELIGDSAELFPCIPKDMDLVWVDGCHCINHVILETAHYSARVRAGGFMLFHDVNSRGQGLCHQYHGPDIPEFGLAIDHAHAAIRFPWAHWARFAEEIPPELHIIDCGTRAYRKGECSEYPNHNHGLRSLPLENP